MAYFDFSIVRKLMRLISEVPTYWLAVRTRRHVNELPEHILKDIGWPDVYAERLGPHGSTKSTDARSVGVKTFHRGIEGRIASPHFGCLGKPPVNLV
ncbi:DUF1127 domain-containing protein [Phyllobacterium zundukense]|uniref:DUF1127 domain-containing protein n=1 Tax=Phyllobacterium zundukense TaxID=1867719 RepID=A0A2N9VY50_9HYPH|nr:hypothetical protein [Phyllobacterium zundukense]ATU94708.1 hypothetical protein BLM14_23360 [Phyllobacterium zundukense]PIO44418.1 hypothetical protein B5P45_12915 [Phyllobacterium zundukense]